MGNEISALTAKTATETTTTCVLPDITTEGTAEEVARLSLARSEAIDSCVTTAKQNSPTAPNCTAKIAKKYGEFSNYPLFDTITVTCTSEKPIMQPIDYSGVVYKKNIIPFEDFIFIQPNPSTTSYATPGGLYDFSWLSGEPNPVRTTIPTPGGRYDFSWISLEEIEKEIEADK